jgi:hypothetical protein
MESRLDDYPGAASRLTPHFDCTDGIFGSVDISPKLVVTVRLYGIPTAISAVVCSFAIIEAAKIDFLVAEHGEAVSVMRAIKRAIDPDNIMNLEKILRV